MDKKFDGVLAIDPGIKACGMSIFEKDRLVYCNVLRPMAVVHPLVGIKEIMALAQAAWDANMGVSYSPELLIVEKPQIYQQQHLKGDPNDLIPLAIMAGMFWERFKPKNIILPQPKEWKGQVPKDVMSRRTLTKLDKREQEVLKEDLIRVPERLRHNGLDSIGIGLYGLNRLRAGK